MQEHTNKPDGTRDVARAILTYLELHPKASDTLEGIARWWVGVDVDIVKEALDLLIEEGELAKSGGRYYRRRNV